MRSGRPGFKAPRVQHDGHIRVLIIACMVPTTSLPGPPPIGDDWALFLDVDGTLLGFADRPGEVRVPDGLTRMLAALSARLDGALALVSGRPVEQLDALFAPLRLPAAGLHGLELRSHGEVRHAPPAPDALAALLRHAAQVAAAHPGTVVEDKGATMALHWRGNPGAEPVMRELAHDAVRRLPGYRVQPGDHVLELRPEGADKGAAIMALMAEPPFHGRRPVFAGDDHTDEHGFEQVIARGGLAILVGDRSPSVARHRLPGPGAVHRWLAAGALAAGAHA